jgi:hypothetical protein
VFITSNEWDKTLLDSQINPHINRSLLTLVLTVLYQKTK